MGAVITRGRLEGPLMLIPLPVKESVPSASTCPEAVYGEGWWPRAIFVECAGGSQDTPARERESEARAVHCESIRRCGSL